MIAGIAGIGHSINTMLNKVNMTSSAKFKFFYMLISKLNLLITTKARLVKIGECIF